MTGVNLGSQFPNAGALYIFRLLLAYIFFARLEAFLETYFFVVGLYFKSLAVRPPEVRDRVPFMTSRRTR